MVKIKKLTYFLFIVTVVTPKRGGKKDMEERKMENKSALPDNWPLNNWQNENNVGLFSLAKQYGSKEIYSPIVPQQVMMPQTESIPQQVIMSQPEIIQQQTIVRTDYEMERLRAASKIRVDEDYCKRLNAVQIREIAESEKQIRDEKERERKKSQVECVTINNEGIPVVYTQNVVCGRTDRKITNLLQLEIIRICCAEDIDKKMHILTAKINSEEKWCVLAPDKCGSGAYVIRALASIGGTIIAKKLSLQKVYAVQLITLLLTTSTRQVVVPRKKGWYTEDNRVRFFDNDYTWERLVRCMV